MFQPVAINLPTIINQLLKIHNQPTIIHAQTRVTHRRQGFDDGILLTRKML